MSSNTVVINGENFWQTDGKGLLTKQELRILRHRAGNLKLATMEFHRSRWLLTLIETIKLYLWMYAKRINRKAHFASDRLAINAWGVLFLSTVYAGQVALWTVRAWEAAIPYAKAASTYVRTEGFHKMIRQNSITALYAVGAIIAVGTLPKILIVVWAL